MLSVAQYLSPALARDIINEYIVIDLQGEQVFYLKEKPRACQGTKLSGPA